MTVIQVFRISWLWCMVISSTAPASKSSMYEWVVRSYLVHVVTRTRVYMSVTSAIRS